MTAKEFVELRVGAPDYVARYSQELKGCPPGHKFRLYFSGWEADWRLAEKEKLNALCQVAQLSEEVKQQVKELILRQECALEGPDLLRFRCVTDSPFTTGLGNEHPSGNGFSFLDPYGVPYFPGSGVKGVIRRAAEELALFEADPRGWTILDVWWLFGFDASSGFFKKIYEKEPAFIREEKLRWQQAYQAHIRSQVVQNTFLFEKLCELLKSGKVGKEEIKQTLVSGQERELLNGLHHKGALHFFDVVPDCGSALRVDIVNPHYRDYYQGEQPPGDWGTPAPVFFLTLPPKTRFTFLVRFQPPLSWPAEVRAFFQEQERGTPRWKNLLAAAFEFAWEWQGFGAKTSIGYGRFRHDFGR